MHYISLPEMALAEVCPSGFLDEIRLQMVPAFKSCIHTLSQLFVCTIPVISCSSPITHSHPTFLTSPCNRLCDKRSPSDPWGQLRELPCSVFKCCHLDSVFCQTMAIVILPFPPMKMCLSVIVNLKGISRLSGSLETHTQTHPHTHMARVLLVSLLVCRSVFQPPCWPSHRDTLISLDR